MNDEQLQITGLTGVELKLPIAGAGSRSYAFLIDWHIRVLLALAWILGAWASLRFMGLLDGAKFGTRHAALIFWPASLLYLLYHPVLELLMHGRTPGKRMAGVRLVMRNGSTPGATAILIRNMFRIIDSLPVFYVVGLCTCLLSAQRVRIGDMAAGTVLVLSDAERARALERLPGIVTQTGLDAELIELLHELLERWPSLEPAHRDAIARSLLARAKPGVEQQALAAANDPELHAQLRGLLPP